MKATIIGRLGRDAELRHTPTGDSILAFSVAEDIGFGSSKKTQWVNCSLWGKRGEGKLGDFLKKGQQVVVFGQVTLRQYPGRDGSPKTSLECYVTDVVLVGGKRDSRAPAEAAEQQEPAAVAPAPADDDVVFDDDDIPF